ncbi:MAG: methyltransferase domain-containing protein [Candidatus Omnitrophota bacterium]
MKEENKETIRKNFSQCAPYYDRYSSVQNLCAEGLIERIRGNNFANILEIGCGTGNYTQLLTGHFPRARIKAVDISPEMIKIAQQKFPPPNVDFIAGDGEKIDFPDSFDLISSNASFQWFADLPGTLLKYRGLLADRGRIAFSLFGPATFGELNESLRVFFSGEMSIAAYSFTSGQGIKKILRNIYQDTAVETKIFRERFDSIRQLLMKIKYTGTRGNGLAQRRLWTAAALRGLEHIYRKQFKEIIATYEVFFCRGVK